ncbi:MULTISPECIES: DoxX family protein [unclassified Colwellia]|uniref:DoxX family protein n=1 Tax=unclassified Colwellia TaxID=196834 RepID=UPI0015F73BD1|nr:MULTISPECIES: DoxX family protein [unclassified Colwellia]MBA6233723.1 DoxX family protein [Colwellia sp. MB02u-7]MBA6237895.1 DoxX family protein [Colwellia sp. MB02u-11]MBA6257210.1 DoxX family protein [Colwellia sp. MB3u-28]MBA6258795.1 DoxX family protein [Colwellia sp. MB3u-41]MBA6300460.1 DoxX family protein [Colwellia sp. MB3u-22]
MHTLNNLVLSTSHLYRNVASNISLLEPLALLAARCYVAWAFFSSGLTKLRDWDSTLMLFEYEYQVPILPFELAAYLGTAAEIILPLLLIAGLASRFSALGLFFVNIVAVISLEEIAPAAFAEHILWGVLLLQVVIFSGGRFALDRIAEEQLFNRKASN